MPDLNKTAQALTRRNFKVRCFNTAAEAKQAVLEMIPEEKSVGAGGSMTLVDMGVLDALRERGNKVYSSYLSAKHGEDEIEARIHGIEADYYLSSANAITEKGEVYNTDGIGNRVASLFYGPETVIIVAGRNKIVKDTAAARARIKSIAGPLNTKRLNRNTPCVKSGKCDDCDSDDRICRVTVILEFAPRKKDIHVFLVNEDLGY